MVLSGYSLVAKKTGSRAIQWFTGTSPCKDVGWLSQFPCAFLSLAGATIAACLMSMGANAQDTSPWVNDTYSAVRLIAGSRSGAAFLGGIAFQLQPGWKTYWRNPGDSGVPPRIDFAKSENIRIRHNPLARAEEISGWRRRHVAGVPEASRSAAADHR